MKSFAIAALCMISQSYADSIGCKMTVDDDSLGLETGKF